MVAAMSTLSGPVATLAEVSRLAADSVGPWLNEYEGYRGTLVLTDEERQLARLVTFWDTAADEARARESRGAMRDQLAATAGMEVVDFGVFEVIGHQFLADLESERTD
jgi:hypothetical protein